MTEVEIAASGGGPGPHFHRSISEAFYVLSGTVRLYDGTEWVDGNATSGVQSALAKRNEQLPEESAAAKDAGLTMYFTGVRHFFH